MSHCFTQLYHETAACACQALSPNFKPAALAKHVKVGAFLLLFGSFFDATDAVAACCPFIWGVSLWEALSLVKEHWLYFWFLSARAQKGVPSRSTRPDQSSNSCGLWERQVRPVYLAKHMGATYLALS